MSVSYEECVDACLECIAACNSCYNACLEEENLKMMVTCIRMDRECADICALAVKAMQTNSPFISQICQLCAEICEACGNECKKHKAEHCQKCAEACFKCAESCRQMVTN
ncbi:four-helix bundle copper-binding protein [Terribacillus saccharophilus]|uniref:four-helix bundle copper-binding protein n=1 Tax=Terribacillus saccharophilus TaxID=361277 RepID=UPI000BA5B3AC|nr:four-helix bundle copper-binding protein [Terribacillus saccharophilus]PAF22117.1 four-helix bundle copper-binding protein [Terribacillus saccharophilus]